MKDDSGKCFYDIANIFIPVVKNKKVKNSDRLYIYKRDGFKCLKCKKKSPLSIDHILPVSKGGLFNIENYQTLCRKCNSEKGSSKIDYRQLKLNKMNKEQLIEKLERNLMIFSASLVAYGETLSTDGSKDIGVMLGVPRMESILTEAYEKLEQEIETLKLEL